jgi:hypothetical protein
MKINKGMDHVNVNQENHFIQFIPDKTFVLLVVKPSKHPCGKATFLDHKLLI